MIVRAPNGDLFVAESGANQVRVLRDEDGDGKPEKNEVFADRPRPARSGSPSTRSARSPNTFTSATPARSSGSPTATATSRRAARPRRSSTTSPAASEQVGGGGHWTRDLAFSKDGKTLFVSVGSRSNNDDDKREDRRADILAFDPDGKNERVYASGIRNPVGLAVHPETGDLWTSVNERDGLGDNLVPDYITRVQEGGFYGWPWYYIGSHDDPRYKGKTHPELKDKAIVPDVLLQAHSASLDMTFYDGNAFPREYRLDAFASEHGSWNRARRTGYKVIRVPMQRRQGDRRVRRLPRRLRHPRRRRLGPPRRRRHRQGRLTDGHRRRLGHRLAGRLRQPEVRAIRDVGCVRRACGRDDRVRVPRTTVVPPRELGRRTLQDSHPVHRRTDHLSAARLVPGCRTADGTA